MRNCLLLVTRSNVLEAELCACEARWCMDRPLVVSPVPARVSVDPGGGRHAEPCHPVEHIGADFCLGLLIGQSSGLKSAADDGLVAKHLGFNQTTSVVETVQNLGG